MKYIKIIITSLSLLTLVPSITFANSFSTGFKATSTTQGWISPNRINGVEQKIVADSFVATSTTATSTFYGGIEAKYLNITGASTATSTSASGINLTGGCFSINGTCITSGTGTVISGGSGGTWSTTTSQVSGRLINYPNNNTDIVTVGSNSTTTAKYWFDPNILTSYFSGNLGIGSTTPITKLVVTDNQGSNGTSTITIQNSTIGTIASPNYMALNFSGVLGAKAQIASLNQETDTVSSSLLFLTRNSSNFLTEGMRLDASQRLGIGTTSPSAKLSIKSNGFTTGRTLAIADSNDAEHITLLDNGNFGIATTSPSNPFTYGGLLQNTTPNGMYISPNLFLSSSVQPKASSIYINPTVSNNIGGVEVTDFAQIRIANSSMGTSNQITNYYGIYEEPGTALATNNYGAYFGDSVGIGTTSPYAPLSVVGLGGVVAENYTATSTTATSTFKGAIIGGNNNGFTLNPAAPANTLYIDSIGKIGVGTSTPVYDVDISNTAATARVGVSSNRFVNLYAGGTYSGLNYNNRGYFAISPGINYTDTLNTGTIFTSTGSIGVGTTSPGLKLTVVGTSALPASSGSTQTGIFRVSSNTGPTLTSTLDFGSYNTTGAGWIQATDVNNLATNRSLALNPNGGSVGIGTAAPGAKTEIVSTSAGALVDELLITNSSQTINTEAGIFFAPTNAGGTIRGARISGLQEDGGNKIGLLFYTGLGATITEKMRLLSPGYLGIGTTTPSGGLDVAGSFHTELNIPATSTSMTLDFCTSKNDSTIGVGSSNITLNLTNSRVCPGKKLSIAINAPLTGVIGSTTPTASTNSDILIWSSSSSGKFPGNSVVNGSTDVFCFQSTASTTDGVTFNRYIAASLCDQR